MPNTVIKNIDFDNLIVETDFYPHIRGAKILERVGITKDASNMFEGDSRPMDFQNQEIPPTQRGII